MFWLTTKKHSETERKISNMHNLLARSFANVKNDTQNIFQWLNYFQKKNQDQENKIKQLQLELSHIPKNPDDIRKIIDSYYSFDSMTERIKMLNDKIDNLPAQKTSPEVMPHSEMHAIEQRLNNLEEQRKATIREKVVKRVTRNSKEYVKSLILSYIRKYTQISGIQLKDMIVYDQGLCSKSSFYRLLEEIESMEDISIVKKGREKYYLHKQISET